MPDSNAPAPRDIPAGKVLLAEYRDVNATNSARVETLARAPCTKFSAEIRLVFSTPGFELAGSCARWTNGYWAVRWTQEGAIHGHRYNAITGEDDARARFARLTTPTA